MAKVTYERELTALLVIDPVVTADQIVETLSSVETLKINAP
jgi:hypothetical protein